MLIKQWQDVHAARHTLSPDDEWESQPLDPHVATNLPKDTAFDRVVVIPHTMAVLLHDSVPCGTIKVTYPQLNTEEEPEDYDDEEQLYAAAAGSAALRRYPEQEVPIVKVGPALGIVVPRFVNPVAEIAVADEIVSLAASATKWTILAPCQLNNGVSICKLDLEGSEIKDIPSLQPPHYITGIGAAVLTALSEKALADSNASVLVLNAEGHSGFEKIDADSVMDAAEVLYTLLQPEDKQKKIHALSQRVRHLNSANTSGMYI